MKKLFCLLLAAVMLSSCCVVFADSASIIIDGELAEIPEDMGKVVLTDNRTFVPIRFVLEYFNYSVTWQESDEVIIVIGPGISGDNILIFQVGNKRFFAKPNGVSTGTYSDMDVAPFINHEEGRTYIPIRFLAEAIGYTVDWDDSTGTAILTSGGSAAEQNQPIESVELGTPPLPDDQSSDETIQ